MSTPVPALPRNLPADKQVIITKILQKLTPVAGIQAIVLGGSYAQGSQRPTSDVDLGLYYEEQSPFEIEAVRRAAAAISTEDASVVTGFYEWGAWVNGGAWIHTAAGKVDFLYRNIDQVRRVIADASSGKLELDYLQQPPYGFHSVIYLAETRICKPLYDPNGVIAALKQQTVNYSPVMKESIIQGSLWGAEFTLMHARDFAHQGDVYNTVGCLTRVMSSLTQALFALNETYFISDKRAIATIAGFTTRPQDYAARVSHILGHPGQTAAELSQTVDELDKLFRDVVEDARQWYQPRYAL